MRRVRSVLPVLLGKLDLRVLPVPLDLLVPLARPVLSARPERLVKLALSVPSVPQVPPEQLALRVQPEPLVRRGQQAPPALLALLGLLVPLALLVRLVLQARPERLVPLDPPVRLPLSRRARPWRTSRPRGRPRRRRSRLRSTPCWPACGPPAISPEKRKSGPDANCTRPIPIV